LQVLLVLFGAGVSLVAFMAVLEGWQAFNVKAKCVAVEFLVTLILYPAVVTKTGKPNDAVQFAGLVFGYALVLKCSSQKLSCTALHGSCRLALNGGPQELGPKGIEVTSTDCCVRLVAMGRAVC
jgi:hypothetical protein